MRKTLPKSWELPLPRPTVNYEWGVYVSARMDEPWGYYQDPDDPYIMWPEPFELNALEKAKEYLREYTYEAVAQWLSEYTGRSITKKGLKLRLQRERKRRTKAYQARWFEKKAKELARKAENYENSPGGLGVRQVYHPENCICPECDPVKAKKYRKGRARRNI